MDDSGPAHGQEWERRDRFLGGRRHRRRRDGRGGIFAVLGLAVQLAHGGTPAAFALAGAVALLSTASTINATLYGVARLSYCMARDGELPTALERKVWRRPVEGLLVTAGLTLLVANTFDLTSISTAGSAGFLLIFAAVNAANARHARHTNSRGWISAAGAVACLAAISALVWQTARTAPVTLWVPAAMVAAAVLIEGSYRLARRKIR